MHERYRRQTDGRTMRYSEPFAKKCINCAGGIVAVLQIIANSTAMSLFYAFWCCWFHLFLSYKRVHFSLLVSLSYATLSTAIVHCFHCTWCQYRYTHLFIQTPNCTIKSTSLNGELQKWHKIPQKVLVLEIFKQLSDGTWYKAYSLSMILVAWEYNKKLSYRRETALQPV